MRHLYLLLLNLIIGPLGVLAQESEPVVFPRWYVGLQYGRQDFLLALKNSAESARTNTRRPQVTVGYQIKPRLAVQLGMAPVTQSFTFGGSGTNPAGQPVSEIGSSKGRSLAIPVLARYTLAAKPWKNLRIDASAGGVLFWSHSQTEFTRTDNGVVTSRYETTTDIMNAFMALGPSARYEFGRHVDVLADWLFYKNLRRGTATQVGGTGNSLGITNSLSLGVRYRFGYR